MSKWNWMGARWWKVDLHSHTPASLDYGKGPRQAILSQRTPAEWLLDYMRAGVDCVAITDHNTGDWIDRLREALDDIERERPDEFRPLYLFPGVEISVFGGVHLLAILDLSKNGSDVSTLLGSAGFSGVRGKHDGVTSKSLSEVVEAVQRAGGIAIPAHVDADDGLFAKISGSSLAQTLETQGISAIEVKDPSTPKPGLYVDKHLRWAEILGSDSHHPPGVGSNHYAGSHFTWIKMGKPSLEGLRLALLDGSLSVRRSDQQSLDPNQHGSSVVESIEVRQARYMGRARPFSVEFNPWLNALIGGRGTGKSTVIEFLRLGLGRTNELPDDLKPEFKKYSVPYDLRSEAGLLTKETEITIVYRKDGDKFRIRWTDEHDRSYPVEEETSEGWVRSEGEVQQRLPVRILSQKQVFHLATDPLALLRIVDESSEVDRRSWDQRWRREETRFLSLRARARELEAGLQEENFLRGELADIQRKLGIFEQSGHSEILKAFQRRRTQLRAVESWEERWADIGERIRHVAQEITPPALEETSLQGEDVLGLSSKARARLSVIQETLVSVAQEAETVISDWHTELAGSAWRKAVGTATAGYEDLKVRLAKEEAGVPEAYGELVHQRQTIEARLSQLDDVRRTVGDLRKEARDSLAGLQAIRRALTASRQAFLDKVLEKNKYVRIRVMPYGARGTVEAEFRKLLHRDGHTFDRDIGSPDGGGLLGRIYAVGYEPSNIERVLEEVKSAVREIAGGTHDSDLVEDQRFAGHLNKLKPESLDRLEAWFPEDSLDVRYSTDGDGRGFRSIEEGSPGQRTAALLAFLLSYGEEPLVLDQPEDDLDNQLIYDLIVAQIREIKRTRQVIVVTHNPNIVVNGDAELVVALAARNGESQKLCDESLQDKLVRDTICRIMEGGREAFEQRYRRILLG